MMYGHYLQKPKQNMTNGCVSVAKLEAENAEFFKELVKRWMEYSSKRTLGFQAAQNQKKRQRALGTNGNDFHISDGASETEGAFSESSKATDMTSSSSKPDPPWHFMSANEKMKRREVCQQAWDKAFVVCGIKHLAADNPTMRDAIKLTRAIPDFKLMCAKTMRNQRLVQLNDTSNQYKQKRLKAGLKYGFLITSDGWRSCAKRQYHNYILVSVEGPIYLGVTEVTGEGGTGKDIHDQFKLQFDQLGEDVLKNILIGVTDTPSANRKAWRLLEATYPKQIWIGCATHEVSLLFKEWVKKIPEIWQLYREGLRAVKHVNNHGDILNLFRRLVPVHFKEDKKKWSISLYMPGDTRMLTVFKMLHRLSVLWAVMADLVSRPEYETASQKALKAWSDNQKLEDKLTAINGKYPDKVKQSFTGERFKTNIDAFINATKSVVYLKSLVDGQTPVLGKFYYCCALVDKHLRIMKESGDVPYIDSMRNIFTKRWKRWHRPIHTLAYALDPCYQGHQLTRQEVKDCKQVLQKMGGAKWASLKVEFDRWRDAGESIFPPEVWDAADNYHGYQWWSSFGDDFEYLQDVASKVLSKPISASACEFNWSDVGNVINKKTQRLGDAKIDAMVNIRAMHKLEQAVSKKVLLGHIPKIDDFLDQLVNDAIENSRNGGDDVEEPDECADDSSDDDETYELEADDDGDLYELGEDNSCVAGASP